MTVSLVYLYGTGILTYRLLRHEKKKTLKLIHAIGTRRASIHIFTYPFYDFMYKKNLQKSGKQKCGHFYNILFKKFRKLIKTLQKLPSFSNFAQTLALQNFPNLPKAGVLS
jgi:hypothetical protein